MLAAIGLSDGSGPGRGDVLGGAPAVRAGRAGAPARRGRRGRPLGRADAARPARVPGRVLERAPDPARLPRAARAPGDPPRLGGAAAEPVARSCWRRSRTPRRVSSSSTRRGELGSGTADADRRDGRGQPALPRAARGRGSRERRGRAAVEHPGGARRAHRPPRARASARCSSTPRSRGAASTSGALEELLPEADRAGIAAHLVALVHKQLIRAERSELPGEDAFRFAHALIREAAYQGLPKQRRAELHERVARWLEAPAGRPGRDHRPPPRRGLPPPGRARARRASASGPWPPAAAERLAAAADAALLRGDSPAGARLLERAASLLESDDAARSELLPALGAALFEAGRIADAARVLDEAIARAPEPRLRARAAGRARARAPRDGDERRDRRRRGGSSTPSCPSSSREGDEHGQCRAWLLRGQLAWNAGRVGARRRGLATRRPRAPPRGRPARAVRGHRLARAGGRRSVRRRSTTAIRRCEEFRALVRASPIATASTLNPLALLHAMKGELDDRRAAARAGRRDAPRARRPQLGRVPSRGVGQAARRAAGARRGARCARTSRRCRR